VHTRTDISASLVTPHFGKRRVGRANWHRGGSWDFMAIV
jgi:hypothetical protein